MVDIIVAREEQELQQEIDSVLQEVQTNSQDNSEPVKKAIASAFDNIENSEVLTGKIEEKQRQNINLTRNKVDYFRVVV